MKPQVSSIVIGLCFVIGVGCASLSLLASNKSSIAADHRSMAALHRQGASRRATAGESRSIRAIHGISSSVASAVRHLPPTALIDVPAQSQLPELPNGCEVTSLSMLLTAVAHPVNKLTLAKEEPTDHTPIVYRSNHRISFWGDPNRGFVGKVNGYPGYGIYHRPIVALINKILPGKAVDLTGHPFTDLLAMVAHKRPVMVWTTANFRPTSDWITWNSPDGPVHATFLEHAVLLVGYNRTKLFINDPLDGSKSKAVDRAPFVQAWQQLGRQAVTIVR